MKAYECLQSGISERKQNIQRDEQKILRGVREIRQRHRASAENQVHDQHREEPNAIDEPAVDIPRSDLDDGVDDHVQRDVALVDDLPIVHAVHEDRLEAQAEEERHQAEHFGSEEELHHAGEVLQNRVSGRSCHGILSGLQAEQDPRTADTHGAEEDKENGSGAVPAGTSASLDVHKLGDDVHAEIAKHLGIRLCFTSSTAPIM